MTNSGHTRQILIAMESKIDAINNCGSTVELDKTLRKLNLTVDGLVVDGDIAVWLVSAQERLLDVWKINLKLWCIS